MNILSSNIEHIVVLFALRKEEDALLLKPALERIEWIVQKFAQVTVLNGTHSGIRKALEEFEGIAFAGPIALEIISHGEPTAQLLCSELDSVHWSEVAEIIGRVGKNHELVVNAMSTCMSFPLVDYLCNAVKAVFASNINSSASAFFRGEKLYTQGLAAFKFAEDLADEPKHYTWCVNGIRENEVQDADRNIMLAKQTQHEPRP